MLGSPESASRGDCVLRGRRRSARSIGNDRQDSYHRPSHFDSRIASVADPTAFLDVLFDSSPKFVSLNAFRSHFGFDSY